MDNKKSQVLKEKKAAISGLQKEQQKIIDLFFNDDVLIEGSFMSVLAKCGKPGCHCEKKPCHPVTRLSAWEGKNLINKIVRIADREWVEKSNLTYKAHKKELKNYTELSKKIKELLKDMIKIKAIKYE